MKKFLRETRLQSVPLLLCLILLVSSLLSACQSSTTPKYQVYTFYNMEALDTFSYVDVYLTSDQDKSTYQKWFQEKLMHYHKLFDAYNSYEGINNVYTINYYAGNQPVVVEKELFDLIHFCLEQREYTLDRTNIAAGAVTIIWKQFMSDVSAERTQARNENRDPIYHLPEDSVLAEAAQHIDPDCIQLDAEAQTVYLTDPHMRLDVGAVAKGYIAELLADEMAQMGIQSALLSLGGNTKIVGERKATDGRTYFISGIDDPNNPGTKEGIGIKIRLDDQFCLVTSGNYLRYEDVDGVRYHHLIDPDTLMPTQGMKSVSILAKDSGLADYLSTALFTVDVETGMEIVSHYEDVEVFWITEDDQQYHTPGFSDYVISWGK